MFTLNEHLAAESIQPNELMRNLETVEVECVWKTSEFFQRKLHEFSK
jgi:hypothetical protein